MCIDRYALFAIVIKYKKKFHVYDHLSLQRARAGAAFMRMYKAGVACHKK
jgi:hypothetical protein